MSATTEVAAGRLARVVDQTGREWARFAWVGDRLNSLEVPGARIDGVIVRDELLGDAHDIVVDGAPVTRVSAVDWARPTEIPAIAAPGRLPAGSGATIINTLALLARHGGVPALRYAGPYPTSALWRTLARSFRTTATEDQFTADLVGRMARLARDPIAIDFAPAPFEQLAIVGHGDRTVRGHVELRDGIERVVLDGIAYEPGGSPARLVDARAPTGTVAAELWFGDARYATIATLSPDGALVDGPHPIPACTSDVIGKVFPPPLVAAIAELVAESVPAPLAGDARAFLVARELRWADLGARVARADGERVELHAAIWQHVAPHGLGRLALALAEALVPVVTHAIVAAVVARGRLAT
jgi:hypothetical protein